MKKIIALLLMSMAVFFNINDVKAAVVFEKGTFYGTCYVSSETSKMCNYNCSVTAEGQELKFDYTVNSENGDYIHSVSNAETNTPEIGSIFGGYNTFSPVSLHLDNYPLDSYFSKNNKFTCKPVEFQVKATYSSDESYTYYDHYIYVLESEDEGEEDDDGNQKTVGCAILGENLTPIIKWALRIIDIAIPILIIILTIVDFLSIVLSGEEKNFKAAGTKLVKRLIIGAFIIFLPMILTVIIDLSGVLGQYGIEKDQLFCSLF